MTGVYMMIIGGKRYIGSSINITKRMCDHRAALKAGRAPSKLQRAFDEHKEFSHTVLEIIPDTERVWELEVRERRWIEELKPELNHYKPGNERCSAESEVDFALRYLDERIKYISKVHKTSNQIKLLKSTASMLLAVARTAEKRIITIGEAKAQKKKGSKTND